MKKYLLVLAAALAAVCCGEKITGGRDTIPLVKQIAVDTSGVLNLVQQYRTRGSEGAVALLGEPEACQAISERFLTADDVDNIRGRGVGDRLPDFAGETFLVCLDDYNAPYAPYLKRGTPEALDSLREVAVKNLLFALDTACHVSAYDSEAALSKMQAKLIIFCNTANAEYGQFDADTLLRIAGRQPLIISTPEAMLEKAYTDGKKNLVAWTDEETAAAGIWEKVSARMQPDFPAPLAVVPDSALDIRTEFRDLLRKYLNTHPEHRLDAVLLDRFDARTDLLSSELDHIRMEMTEEDARFNKALSGTFRFITPAESVTWKTYRLLREENLFTHKIAYPALHYYRSEESIDGDFVYVEVGTDYFQSHYVQGND